MLTAAAITTSTSVIASCDGDGGNTGAVREAIVDADGSDPASELFPFVVALNGHGSCSGTLIAPSWVLTAAHCVDTASPSHATFSGIIEGPSDRHGTRVPVAACHMHPAYTHAYRRELLPAYRDVPPEELGDRCGVLDSRAREPTTGELVDIALVQLARPVPRAAAATGVLGAGELFVDPVDLYAGPPLPPIPPYTVVGYGTTTPADPILGGGEGAGTKRFRGNWGASWSVNLLTSEAVLGGADSGGPLLASIDGRWRVVGVAGNASTVASTWVNVTAYTGWIRTIVDADGDSQPDIACAEGFHDASRADIDPADDADSDFIPEVVDTCPGVYNPCQLSIDSDGDGADDDCDACPVHAGIAAPLGAVMPDSDVYLGRPDPDGVPDVCDCDPSVPTPWEDLDGDAIRDRCDNCPATPNLLQENCDGGLDGDACQDVDHDEVLDVCGTVDNCVGAENPVVGDEQPNCNLDVEEVALDDCLDSASPEECPRRDYVRGDACDETPCGDTLFGGARTPTGGVVAQDLIRVDAIADVDAPIEARTGFRFCRCSSARGADTLEEHLSCLETEAVATDPSRPEASTAGGCDPRTAASSYDRLDDEPNSWRWTTVEYTTVTAGPRPGAGLNVEAPTDHVRRVEGTFDEDLIARWRYEQDDVPRWVDDFGEIIASGPGAFLPGVLLTHQPGGQTAGSLASWDRELSSHLASGVLRYEATLPVPPVPGCASAFPFSFSGAFCPFCGGSFPRPWAMGDCGGSFRGLIDLAGIRVDPSVIGSPPIPSPPIDGAWLGPSEPLPSLRGDSVRVVGLAPGPVVERAFIEVGGQLQDLLSPCSVPGQCDPIPLAARLALVDAPPPRTDAVTVLSGTRAELYVLGGRDVSGPRPDVWAFDIRREAWRVLSGRSDFGTVLSAAFDPTRGELIVLDQIERRIRRRTVHEARILSIPVEPSSTRLGRVLASFPRVTSNDRFALAIDVAGDVWVAASPPGRAHVLLELEREGDSLRIGGFRAGAGRVAAGDVLRVDPLGATLLLEDRALGVTPHGVRHRELHRIPAAAARCF